MRARIEDEGEGEGEDEGSSRQHKWMPLVLVEERRLLCDYFGLLMVVDEVVLFYPLPSAAELVHVVRARRSSDLHVVLRLDVVLQGLNTQVGFGS